MSKLRVGIVGTGHLGAFHARVYAMIASNPKNNVAFVGVCDICEDRAKEIADKYGTKYFTDYKSMLDIVDAVSIVVPTFLHHVVARDFLKAGVHVLVEKPITKTLEEADELIKLAAKKNLALQVGHIERFNSAVRGDRAVSFKTHFHRVPAPGFHKRKGRIKDVGVVLDLMIHDIDIILSLVNSKVKNMVAFGASTVSEHEDIANVRITFENNVIADITANRVTKEEVRKLRIFQEDSYLLLDYMTHEAFLFKKSKKELKKTKLRIKRQDALEVELASFLECVRDNKRPIVSGIEGRQALKVGLDILDKINGKM